MVEDRNTRPVIYVDPAAHSLEDPPMKRTDWKGIAVMITAIVGALGFCWNAGKGCYDQGKTQAVQSASYEVLAGKVEGLYARVATLEAVLRMLPSLFQKNAPMAEKMVSTLHGPLPEPAPWEPPTRVPVDAGGEASIHLAPPEQLFQKSGLPTFQKLQERAKAE